MKTGPALTWDELAAFYDGEHSGRCARTMQMDHIFAWAAKQVDRFAVCPDAGTIHLNPQVPG